MDFSHVNDPPLPAPTLTLTLPSIRDNTPLDCRVYHPLSLSTSPRVPAWSKHVAIVAHPYSPLGGCQDDRIVSVAAGALLRLGFMVATFNFRGAGGSPGHTTWSGKAERADYMSAIGFLTYYSHYLDPFPRNLGSASDAVVPTTEPPIFLFGGYSYGGNIVTQLPSHDTILSMFESPVAGSPAAEIRMRAQHTAEMQNTVLASARAARTTPHSNGERSPRKSLGVRIGGDEENRKSHESRRSFSFDPDEIKRGVADIMHKTSRKHHQHRAHLGQNPDVAQEERLAPVTELVKHQPSYLLISPPQGMFRNILNLSIGNPFSSSKLRRTSSKSLPMTSAPDAPDVGNHGLESLDSLSEAERKLVCNTTLAIYGDQDVFVPLKKTRDWASSLTSVPGSRFRAHEVSGAGHFWVEGRVLFILEDALKSYGNSLLHASGHTAA